MRFVDKLHVRDARNLAQVVSSTPPCVDITITSPPYWNLKDYGTANQIGFGQNKLEYLADLQKVLKACFQVTKGTGSLWLIVDDFRQDGVLQLLPMEVAERARQVGWILRDLIIWDKQHSVPWHRKGQMRNVLETILFMTKSDDYKFYVDRVKKLDEISKWWVDFPERFNPNGITPTNIWSIPIRAQGTWRKPSDLNHHCPFPTALVARIIELTTDANDLVMDPFAGSGVVLAQAAAMKRHYVGFEVNEMYVKMFSNVVLKEVAAEWEELKQWRAREDRVKVGFQKTIMKLRVLKFARQLTKPFSAIGPGIRRNRIEAIVCIASIPRAFKREHPIETNIWIVVNEKPNSFQAELREARKRASHAPLSQYGVSYQMGVITREGLRRKIDSELSLYLYPAHKPRKHAGRASLRAWFEKDRLQQTARESGKIPMLSNVRVDVSWVLDGG